MERIISRLYKVDGNILGVEDKHTPRTHARTHMRVGTHTFRNVYYSKKHGRDQALKSTVKNKELRYKIKNYINKVRNYMNISIID